jgi:TPR repeat protein
MNAAEADKEGSAAYSRGDYSEALRLFRIAADQGHADAQNTLGRIYSNGVATPTDYVEAAKWFRRSAEGGDIDSQYCLGCCYDEGKGVPKDVVLAYMWLSLAARTGHFRSVDWLPKVAKRMTPVQIAEAEKLVRDSDIQSNLPPCSVQTPTR